MYGKPANPGQKSESLPQFEWLPKIVSAIDKTRFRDQPLLNVNTFLKAANPTVDVAVLNLY